MFSSLSTTSHVFLLLLMAGSGTLATPAWPATLGPRASESLDGTLFCGNFASGSKGTASGLLTDLDAGANGKISDREFTVGAGRCKRVHCWETTGIYVCNDFHKSLTVSGNDVWNAANRVYHLCCRQDYSGLAYNPGISGQKFVRSKGRWNWNAVLGYADCQHSNDVKPSREGGWGVNPSCVGGDLNEYQS